MSWKSLVSAGLLCVLASPAFAVPQLEIVFGGINSSGNFVWNVNIAPTAVGTPLDAELAFGETGTRSITSVSNSASATWDTNVPGNAPASYAWVTKYGTPLAAEGLEADCPIGCTVTNAAILPAGGNAVTNLHTPGTLDQIFAALGSKDLIAGDLTVASHVSSVAGFGTVNASTPILQITVARPIAGDSTSTLALLGGYDSNTSGHVSEITTGTNSTNYKGFSGTATRKLIAGDADLSNGVLNTTPAVTGSDLVILAQNITGAQGSKIWTQGDFTGDGSVTGADLVIIAQNIGNSDAAHIGLTTEVAKNGVLDTPGAGSGLGAGSAVPEPASIALLGLALLGSLGLVRRKR